MAEFLGASVWLNSKLGTGFKNRISSSAIIRETSHHHVLTVGMVENLPKAIVFQNQQGDSCCRSRALTSLKGFCSARVVTHWILSEAAIMDELDTQVKNTP